MSLKGTFLPERQEKPWPEAQALHRSYRLANVAGYTWGFIVVKNNFIAPTSFLRYNTIKQKKASKNIPSSIGLNI